MNNYIKIKNQDIENINDEDFFAGMSNENRELFKCALSEVMDLKIRKIEEEIKDVELPELSKSYKIRMNRLFFEHTCGAFLPFPEEDSF